jgi:hypothetical protein
MAIRFHPTEFLRKVAPKKKVERLVKGNLSLNKAVLSTLSESGLNKKALEETALSVIKNYKKRYREERKDGASKAEALEEATNDKRLMVSRVQNEVVFQIHKGIRREYRGEFYEWLPSDAEVPDELHQLKYGGRFQIGKGEMPGDRYGCRCGMNILVDETRLAI